MNIAPQKKDMLASACVRPSVCTLAIGCLLGASLSCTVAAAQDQNGRAQTQERRDEARAAQPARETGYEQRQQQRPVDSRGAEQRQPDPRSYETRDAQRRAPENQDQSHADGFRRNGRMSDDERRDLRRQINEAGHDIYVDRPRR